MIAIFVLLSCNLTIAQDEVRIEVDKLILYEAEWDRTLVPGFVISLIEADTIFHLGYGTLEDSNAQYQNFEIGSFTKCFTAAYLEWLLAHGLVSQEATLDDLTPSSDIDNAHNLYELKHNLTGLPKRPDFIGKTQRDPRQAYENYSKVNLLDYYKSANKTKAFSYAHTNYALIELALDQVVQDGFITGINTFLQSTLLMKSSWVGNTNDSLITQGHDRAARQCEPMQFPSFAGSEGMRSNAHDLSNFLQKEMIMIADKVEGQPENSFASGINFQYPWFKFKKRDYDIYTFAGRTAGHNCQVFVCTSTQTAVLIISNGHVGVNHLPLNVLRMMNDNWKRELKK